MIFTEFSDKKSGIKNSLLIFKEYKDATKDVKENPTARIVIII